MESFNLSDDQMRVLADLENEPIDKTAVIDWKTQGLFGAITKRTWGIPGPALRLLHAKLDLLAKGFRVEAALLDIERLNGAYYNNMDKDAQREIAESRDALKKRGKDASAPPSDKRKRERQQTRKADSARLTRVAKTIGADGVADSAPMSGGGDQKQTPTSQPSRATMMRGFKVEIRKLEEPADETMVVGELTACVFVEKSKFDTLAMDVLIARVSGAGAGATVGKPKRVNERTVIVAVTRQNSDDIIGWLNPGGDDDDNKLKRNKMSETCKELFGEHVDYSLLNNAFKQLVPSNESWEVTITVVHPYTIGETKDMAVFRGRGQSDAFVVVPILRSTPDVYQEAVGFDM